MEIDDQPIGGNKNKSVPMDIDDQPLPGRKNIDIDD